MFKKIYTWWLMNVFRSPLYNKYENIKFGIRNMIFRGHNNIRLTKFSGKDWVETDVRLFEAVFECLREFAEEQEAWMASWDEGWWIRWKMRWLPNRFRRQLSRRLAEKHWEWEMTDTELVGDIDVEGSQANRARKIKELYTWYMDVYDKIDPWDNAPEPPGGFSSLFSSANQPDENSPEWKAYWKKSHASSAEEERLYKEATDKAMEVLKIRDSLWT